MHTTQFQLLDCSHGLFVRFRSPIGCTNIKDLIACCRLFVSQTSPRVLYRLMTTSQTDCLYLARFSFSQLYQDFPAAAAELLDVGLPGQEPPYARLASQAVHSNKSFKVTAEMPLIGVSVALWMSHLRTSLRGFALHVIQPDQHQSALCVRHADKRGTAQPCCAVVSVAVHSFRDWLACKHVVLLQ